MSFFALLFGIVFTLAIVLRVAQLGGGSGMSPISASANAGRRRGTAHVLLAGFFVLAALLFVAAIYMARARVEPDAVVVADVVATPAIPATLAWEQMFAEEPGAARDPHTSFETLAAFMTERVDTALEHVAERGEKRWLIADEDVPPVVVATVGRDVGSSGPKPETRGVHETFVKLRWENRTEVSQSWWPTPLVQGTIVAEIEGPHGKKVVEAKFDGKPWLQRLPNTGDRNDYVVVTSGPTPAASREQAIQLLNAAKVKQLVKLVGSRTAATSGRWQVSADDVRQQVLSRYPDMPPTAFDDRAIVAVDRPYGRVWIAAGLLHVPSPAVGQIAQAAQNVSAERRTNWARMIGGSIGMLFVLLIAYAGVNAITRGYFRAHLRAAVVLLLAVAVAAMFLMMA